MRKLLVVIFCLLTSVAQAEEKVLQQNVQMGNGMVCDSSQQVKDVLDLLEAGLPAQVAVASVGGCGFLQAVLDLNIVQLGVYNGKDYQYVIVRYEFTAPGVPVQYGIYARVKTSDM